MKKVLEGLIVLLIVVTWLAGIVLAKGFWSTFFSIYVPPYAWYLVVEKLMMIWGLV